MDERWISDYEATMVEMFNGGEYKSVGYVSYASVREVKQENLDVSWYPNIYDRFHEVGILLPRSAFVRLSG